MIGGVLKSKGQGSSNMHMQRLPQPRRHSFCIESDVRTVGSGFEAVLFDTYAGTEFI